MSESRLTVQIPTKPHLKKYLAFQLKEANGQIPLSAKTAVGAFFYSMLQTGSGKPTPKKDYACCIEFNVPAVDQYANNYDGRYTGIEISDVNIERANDFFEFLFNQNLFSKLDYIKEKGEIVRKGGKLKQTILNFLLKFDITEEEMPYETIKKRYQRHSEGSETLLDKAL